jgi:hypothetical protein
MLAFSRLYCFSWLASLVLATTVAAAPPPPGLIHIRGIVLAHSPKTLTVATTSGTVVVALPSKIGVSGLIASSRDEVKAGSFLGIASVPNMTGGQIAREVVVFPNSLRGAGEGSYPWDLPGNGSFHSKMTNGTVEASPQAAGNAGHSKMTNGTVALSSGNNVTLTYKSGGSAGSQKISLPPGIPFVTFAPGSTALLIKGVHVFVVGEKLTSGSVEAVRIVAGLNGVIPPM